MNASTIYRGLQLLLISLVTIGASAQELKSSGVDEFVEELKLERDPGEVRMFQVRLMEEIARIAAKDAWTLVRAALENEDEEIVKAALVAASRIEPKVQIPEELLLVDYLWELVYSSSAEVRMYARRLLVHIEADSLVSEGWLVLMLQEEEDQSAAVDIIRQLNIDHIQTDVAREELLKLASEERNRVGHRAMSILSYQSKPPVEALPIIIAYVLSREYFADPNLVQSLPRFGREATSYLASLEQLRDDLELQIAKPVSERNVEIYNEQFSIEQLDEAISRLGELAEEAVNR